MLVLLTAQRWSAAQSSGFDFSSGYGYLPDGYNRLAASQMNLPPAPAPGAPGMPGPAPVPYPTPMPEYQPGPVEGEFFGSSCAGVCWQVVGDYLYIRPSNSDVAYAQVVNGVVVEASAPGTLPMGRTGVSNNFYDPGFRVSAARALGDCAAIGVSYTYFENNVASTLFATDNQQGLGPPNTQVLGLVFHPNATNCALLGDTALAQQLVRFQLADVDYKAAMVSGPRYCANVLVGARFASLRQHFDSSVTTGGGFSELMLTNVKFDGGGIRLGIEGERQSPSSGFLVYGKGTASLVAGTFRADFSEFNNATAFVADSAWRSNRAITMLDFEVGAGFTSEDGAIRVTGGWMVSGWYNTVKPAKYIRAVQQNDYTILDAPMENVLAFDGLVFRVEWRF
jgi:hypothetical protein